MLKFLTFTFSLFLFFGLISSSYACSAKNDVGDVCETNCSAGQVASCSNATGANPPKCSCLSTFVYPDSYMQLPVDQQIAIRKVLVDSKLLTSTGQVNQFTEKDLSPKSKQSIDQVFSSTGIQKNANISTASFLGINLGCIAARAAEGLAVAACATIPGGQLAIAVCVAAAHEAANQACK